MKTFAAIAALMLVSCAATAADLRPIDDGYTISQRFDGYKDKYPGIAWPAVEPQTGQKILFDQRYKRDGERELHADVFLPAKPNGQGIVLIHGGGWRSGDKSHFYALANRLSQRGYTVILPEFRLSAEARYPTSLIDVNDAILWAKSNAKDFGFAKLALGGASSGGQMAALLAYTADQDLFKQPGSDTSVNAVIDLDGVLDFTDPEALKFENARGDTSAAGLWLGGSWEKAGDTWAEASAATHVGAKSPPTLIISSGLMRFTVGRQKVEAALDRFGIAHDYLEFANAPHDVWLFDPWQTQIVDKMDSFLKAVK
ncbi:alpha/beta hydrolase [Asticcacaulis sp. BE141]|nr:alpha/beta hydrolase [Asticcacaulis sp. BE141]MBP2158827.1 pectinesterase [Asticcacaulis solisilvae]MDR6799873.1 pectinesterase [Asticcacaulis sp. BE141]